MRGRKAIVNALVGLLYELVTVLCGFILPRLILSSFGSAYNGITSSVTHFLQYVTLMRAGIGGVSVAALYRPLSVKDVTGISAIVNATDKFMKKVAGIFAASLLVFAAVYPLFVMEDFDWLFTFLLVLILGISTFLQNYFGLSSAILLKADQKYYVVSLVRIGSTILNILLAEVLIRAGAGIHLVKLGSALAFSISPVILNIYVKKYYKIDRAVPPDNEAIRNRWDCLGLQLADFINKNTDMMILTVFTDVRLVSVYTVYHMITYAVHKILVAFVDGMGATFGNMFANQEKKNIYQNFKLYEQVTFASANFLLSVTMVMILSFVRIYTRDVNDIEYIRPAFSCILVAATLFDAYRLPYQSIVAAVGHFRQTRNGGFAEAALNIMISVILVSKLGLIGVAIGTLCAAVFRTFQYGIYMSRHIIKRSILHMMKRMILSLLSFWCIIALCGCLHLKEPDSFFQWALNCIPVVFIAGSVVFLVEFLFYRQDMILLTAKIYRAVFRRGKGKVI